MLDSNVVELVVVKEKDVALEQAVAKVEEIFPWPEKAWWNIFATKIQNASILARELVLNALRDMYNTIAAKDAQIEALQKQLAETRAAYQLLIE